ncbi:MAG: 50S ribosomal protein L2 [Nanoarchaeota archaeon]|nr:50S ribosomal protein L2 [Nanoarchaeota archaeon]
MGKNIIAQARGKGGPTYRAPSFRYRGEAKHPNYAKETIHGKIIDFVHCAGHSAPLAEIQFENGDLNLMIAPEGLKVGDFVDAGTEAEIKEGNTLPLAKIPEGTLVFNIESIPGDGGKFVRSSGTFAKVLSKYGKQITVQLPSKKRRIFSPLCRASIGVVSSGGRTEKPLLKAGNAYHKMKAKNKLWPRTSGAKMNAVDHPFGNKRSSRKSKARPISRNAPPGRKVGTVAARRTGRKKK